MIVPRSPISSHAIADHYDELDRFYREIWGEHVHHGLWQSGDETSEQAVRQLVDFVADRGRIADGARVCDIGCGYGATARLLAGKFDATVTALTVSRAQFQFASSVQKAVSNPRFLLCDWLKNDLPSGTFDAVIAIESSEHMPDKPAFFAQAHRVLRAGGWAVICAWLSAENPTAFHERYLLEPICREGQMPGIGTESDYRHWLAEGGFSIDSFEDLSARVKRTWPICIRRFLINLARRPSYLRFLFNRHAHNRIFVLTIARIWLAYNLGAMRYGIFAARRSPRCDFAGPLVTRPESTKDRGLSLCG